MLEEKIEEFVYKPIHPSMERKTQKELSIKEFTILHEVCKLDFYTNIIKPKPHQILQKHYLGDSVGTLK